MNYIEIIITSIIFSIIMAMIAGAGASEHKMALELKREAENRAAIIEQIILPT